MQIENPYVQYMYSYPHKTAYERLENIDLKAFLNLLIGKKNSLYFHIPFCQYKCGYCNLFSLAAQQERMMQDYIDAMERQAEQIKQALSDDVEFLDVTLGGGTPLILPENLLERVFCIAKEYFGFRQEGHPVVVETSPNQTTEEKLHVLKKNGVTRVSIGVQSFQKNELKTLNRFHTPESAKRALSLIKQADFSCVNIDLIYGIPGQTKESFQDSLEQALSFQPEELFIYPLYVKQGTALFKQGVKQSRTAYEMYFSIRDRLEKEGYHPYSMRRFVRKQDKELETSLCGFGNTLSIGCGGRSYIGNLHFCTPYAVQQEHCLSIIKDYIEKTDYMQVEYGFLLSEEEERRRYVIKHILFGEGISKEDYKKNFHGEVQQDFHQITEWLEKGYAVMTAEHIMLTKEGIALSDYLGPMLISSSVKERMKRWREADGAE